MRVFCIVAYKGTNYYGWEKQIGQDSVQEQLEKAIGKILNAEINIYASGIGRICFSVHSFQLNPEFRRSRNTDY